MKKTNLKNAKNSSEKGITLVALIITIVILLILAIVTVSEIQGDGIIQHAINAKKQYEIAQAQEIASVGILEAFVTNNVIEGEVDPLEAAISNLEKAGYEVRTELLSGVTGVKFISNEGGIEISKLNLQKEETVEIKVSVVADGAEKNYVKIDKLYHEIVYNAQNKTVTISEDGIEELVSTGENTNITVTASNLATINGQNSVTVASDEKITIAAGTTAGSGKITGACGAVTGEIDVEVEEATTLSVAPTEVTIQAGSTAEVTISGTNYGNLSVTSSNSTAAIGAIEGTTLTIQGVVAGEATITVRESKKNQTAEIKVIVEQNTTLSASSTTVTLQIGETSTVEISGTNYGILSASSSASSKATASISGTTLTIEGKASGEATITVIESKKNQTAEIKVIVEQNTTLSASPTEVEVEEGKPVYVTISGNNYGTLTPTSSDYSKATATISGTTLTIKGVAEGTATITVTEGKRNQTATIAVTITASGLKIGDYVKYDVSYTDMYQTDTSTTSGMKEYTANDGWRYFGVDRATGRNMIISTGTPLILSYGSGDPTWFGTTTEAETAYGTGNTGIAYRAAYGLINKFTSITFIQGTSTNSNEGYFTKIGSKTSGTLFQDGANEFIALGAEGSTIRTATYDEINTLDSMDSLRRTGFTYWLGTAINTYHLNYVLRR